MFSFEYFQPSLFIIRNVTFNVIQKSFLLALAQHFWSVRMTIQMCRVSDIMYRTDFLNSPIGVIDTQCSSHFCLQDNLYRILISLFFFMLLLNLVCTAAISFLSEVIHFVVCYSFKLKILINLSLKTTKLRLITEDVNQQIIPK